MIGSLGATVKVFFVGRSARETEPRTESKRDLHSQCHTNGQLLQLRMKSRAKSSLIGRGMKGNMDLSDGPTIAKSSAFIFASGERLVETVAATSDAAVGAIVNLVYM